MAAPQRISVRAAQPQDAAAWENLREALWSGERERHANEIASFFLGALEEPEGALLAETTDGNIVGLVELSLRSDIPGLRGERTGYIEGLFVLPSHRCQGIAKLLVQHARQWAYQQACTAFASDRDDRIVVDRRFAPATSREAS